MMTYRCWYDRIVDAFAVLFGRAIAVRDWREEGES